MTSPVVEPAKSNENSRTSAEVAFLRASYAAGRLAQTAVRAVVKARGLASTGTPIALLRGVAQQNALLSRIGGGALHASGSGIAGGIRRLTALGYAPVVVASGLVVAVEVRYALRSRKPTGAAPAPVDNASSALP